MTDDIVARLRGPYEWRSIDVKYGDGVYDETPLDAADEIERLREKLRAIACVAPPHRDAPTYTVQHLQGTIDAMQTLARAALGEKANDAAT